MCLECYNEYEKRERAVNSFSADTVEKYIEVKFLNEKWAMEKITIFYYAYLNALDKEFAAFLKFAKCRKEIEL